MCECNHLTNFAVLVVSNNIPFIEYLYCNNPWGGFRFVQAEQLHYIIRQLLLYFMHQISIPYLKNVNAPPMDPSVIEASRIVSIIGCVLSMIGLILTIFTMTFFK